MPDVTPAAIPWYKSSVISGVLTIVVTQALSRLSTRYHIDFALFGLNVSVIVNWLMDLISAGAAYFVLQARRTQKTAPVVTLTQKAADVHPAALAAERQAMASEKSTVAPPVLNPPEDTQ